MRVLLDTHTIVWAGESPELLSPRGMSAMKGAGTEILVSAASAWEIATKVRKGKWPEAALLESNFLDALSLAGFKLLSISIEDALRAGRLPGDHKDPWDRMIAAQALALDIPIISNDAKLDIFGVRRIW